MGDRVKWHLLAGRARVVERQFRQPRAPSPRVQLYAVCETGRSIGVMAGRITHLIHAIVSAGRRLPDGQD